MIPRPTPAARLRLICFPHAGSGASCFTAWAAPLQARGIELRAIQYPGREARLHQPLITDALTMARQLADAWPEIAGDGPCAFFGHSMGALLAFELSVELQRRGESTLPDVVFLSGRNAPHTPSNLPPLHLLPDAEFLDEIARRYGQIPAELRMHPDVVAMILPILRADFTLVRTYSVVPGTQVDLPLVVLGGKSDPWTTPADLAEWDRYTRASCAVHHIPGDHFFHQQNRDQVIRVLEESLLVSVG